MRPTQRRVEDWERTQREWAAMPFEGRVAMAVIPLGILVFVHALHLVPIVREAASMEELSAAAVLMALFSALLIQRTFLAATEKTAATQREAHVRVKAVLEGDAGIVAGGSSVLLRVERTAIEKLALLNGHDPGFSEAMLGQFSRALLGRIAAAGTDEARAALAPYVARGPMGELRQLLDGTERVLPGPARVRDVEEGAVWTTLEVDQPFLAARGGTIQRANLVWTLRRTSAARSPSPVDMLRFACPACGAPVEVTHPDGHCTTCDTGITHGQLCWQVTAVQGRLGVPMWPEGRPGGGEHPSVLPKTIEDVALEAALRGLHARQPDVDPSALERRAAQATAAWFEALIAGKADQVAPFLSQDLAASLRYELGRLQAGRLTLSGGPVQVDQVEWSRVGRDGWHEVADLRVFLTLPWHVVDADGNTVDGDPSQPRELSVYARLHHPTGPAGRLVDWKLWQVVDPRELVS